jgi:hypothetical protein
LALYSRTRCVLVRPDGGGHGTSTPIPNAY